MEPGFVKGQSDNLPKIDSTMMAVYFSMNMDFIAAETRGVKAGRSARESYGDTAIGYVQVKRDGDVCTVKGRITPEHNVRKKTYSVILICDEKEETIRSVQCEDCVASQGGCKHAVAFLAWVHRRSEEPSPTSVQCYWKKSQLSCVGTSQKFIRASMLSKKCERALPPGDGSLLAKFVEKIQEQDIRHIQLTNYILSPSDMERMSIHLLYQGYKTNASSPTAQEFCLYATGQMCQEHCDSVTKATMQQADCPLWHELRYGRITASKAYAAARCETLEGSLMESILGARFKATEAMTRGQTLEKSVLRVPKKTVNKPIEKSGLILNPDYPIFGASPDGIGENFVVEVKCPMSEKTMKTYFTDDDAPANKYMAQIQLQMLFSKKNKALFYVAHPDFEQTKNITISWIDYNDDFCKGIIDRGLNFWCHAIFPHL